MEFNFEDELNQQEQQQPKIPVCRQNCHQRYMARNLNRGRKTPSQQTHEQHHIEQIPKAPHAKPRIAAQVDTSFIVPNGTRSQISLPK
ncbi:shikimate O-hydroxycinnamoyltransferase-like protein [Corchorus olitorius]|uniref:Shikimate O-hydroxycinnamoyltransferase-like protein n=1 Tax=Corchorus olitorius TaxID=93759 RepID=A0A1R3KR82_9ROSI|nr:shikimate O-hydroxycinnamoyltransferase-like protein [Corchorus olitorius]